MVGVVGVMRMGLLAVIFAAALPAQAADTRFIGNGVVTAVTPSAGIASGTVAVGDAFSIGFSFDTAAASLVFNGGPAFQVFEQPLTSVSASAGGYTFGLDESLPPVILLGTGFQLFPGQSASVPVLNQQFILPGSPDGNPPFVVSPTGGVTFSITSTFLQDLTGTPVSLANLSDPANAVVNRFQFVVSDGRSQLGIVEGTFAGLFVAAAVPEPGTWVMLILGFGAVGGAMRARRPAPIASAA